MSTLAEDDSSNGALKTPHKQSNGPRSYAYAGSPNWIDINLYAFSLLLIAILVACEVGWQVGLRAEGHGGSNVATLEGSLFGLLALIIGFTFVMALARYEGRREAVLNEANAIGATALRARLLPEPNRIEVLNLLREYAQMRVDYIQSGKSLAALSTIVVKVCT